MSNQSFVEKYPLTEKEFPLRTQTYKRWQYTLSGWIRLIKCGPDDANLERQILNRMWEDSEYSDKIRAEFEKWLAEGEQWRDEGLEEEEDDIRKSHRKTIRNQGKYKSRGKERKREP